MGNINWNDQYLGYIVQMSNIDHYAYECPHLNWAPKDYVPLCGGQRSYYITPTSDDFSKIMQQRLYSMKDKLISQKSPFHEILHPKMRLVEVTMCLIWNFKMYQNNKCNFIFQPTNKRHNIVAKETFTYKMKITFGKSKSKDVHLWCWHMVRRGKSYIENILVENEEVDV